MTNYQKAVEILERAAIIGIAQAKVYNENSSPVRFSECDCESCRNARLEKNILVDNQ